MALSPWLRSWPRKLFASSTKKSVQAPGRSTKACSRRLEVEVLEDRTVPSTVSVRTVPLTANDLVYDPLDKMLYASVPGNAGPNGNSLAQINPVTGQVVATYFVGSNPSQLAVSLDGQYIYAGLNGSSEVVRFNLNTHSVDQTILLPTGLVAAALAVDPEDSQAVAVSLFNPQISPGSQGFYLYVNGVQRANVAYGGTSMTFSPDGNYVYGYDSQTTGFDFTQSRVNLANGLTVVQGNGSLISGFNVSIQAAPNGLVYSSDGATIDPQAPGMRVVGTYSVGFSSEPVPDTADNLTYYIVGNQLEQYSLSQFTLLQSWTVPATTGVVTQWNSNGLAYLDSSNVYLVDLSAPTSVQCSFSGPASSLPSGDFITENGGFTINASNQAVSTQPATTYNVAALRTFTAADVSVSADVQQSPGHSGVAVILRSQNTLNAGNCYFAALTPGSNGLNQIYIGKVVNAAQFGLAAVALPSSVTGGALSFDAVGDTLSVYLNGQLELTTTDSTFTAPGVVGFGDQGGGSTFANFTATTLTAPALPFTDTFQRSTSNTLGSPWIVSGQLPASLGVPGGGFGINGANQAISLGAGLNVASLFGVNLATLTDVSATVVLDGAGAGVVADWNNSTQSGYELLLNGTSLQLYKVIGGGAHTLGPAQTVSGSSGIVRLVSTGGTLQVFFNGGLVFSLNDSTFTSGSAGLMANGAGATFSSFSLSGS